MWQATGSAQSTTVRTTCRCSSGSPKGYRHLLKRRDLEAFIALIPDWDELSVGMSWIVLARDTNYMGYHERGLVAVCAWPAPLWHEDMCKDWYWEHADVLDRLGVDVWKDGPRWVAAWTEDQARAFQLLHVFLHEIGHHCDCVTTRTRRRAARGEGYAEAFAVELEERVWDDFVRTFPL